MANILILYFYLSTPADMEMNLVKFKTFPDSSRLHWKPSVNSYDAAFQKKSRQRLAWVKFDLGKKTNECVRLNKDILYVGDANAHRLNYCHSAESCLHPNTKAVFTVPIGQLEDKLQQAGKSDIYSSSGFPSVGVHEEKGKQWRKLSMHTIGLLRWGTSDNRA